MCRRAETRERQDELVITQNALDRAGAQAAEFRVELADAQSELDRARMAAGEVDRLRTKLTDAELALREARHSQEQTHLRLERLEAQLTAAEGVALASEQLRMAQQRMREAATPEDGEDAREDASP